MLLVASLAWVMIVGLVPLPLLLTSGAIGGMVLLVYRALCAPHLTIVVLRFLVIPSSVPPHALATTLGDLPPPGQLTSVPLITAHTQVLTMSQANIASLPLPSLAPSAVLSGPHLGGPTHTAVAHHSQPGMILSRQQSHFHRSSLTKPGQATSWR